MVKDHTFALFNFGTLPLDTTPVGAGDPRKLTPRSPPDDLLGLGVLVAGPEDCALLLDDGQQG